MCGGCPLIRRLQEAGQRRLALQCVLTACCIGGSERANAADLSVRPAVLRKELPEGAGQIEQNGIRAGNLRASAVAELRQDFGARDLG